MKSCRACGRTQEDDFCSRSCLYQKLVSLWQEYREILKRYRNNL